MWFEELKMSFANFKSSKNGYLGRVTKIRDCKFAHSISRRRWAGFEAIKMITVGRVGFDELNDTVRRRIGPDGSPACQVAGQAGLPSGPMRQIGGAHV